MNKFSEMSQPLKKILIPGKFLFYQVQSNQLYRVISLRNEVIFRKRY